MSWRVRTGGQCRHLLQWLILRQIRPLNCLNGVPFKILVNLVDQNTLHFSSRVTIVNCSTRYMVAILVLGFKYHTEDELIAFCRAFLLHKRRAPVFYKVMLFLTAVNPKVLIELLDTMVNFLVAINTRKPRAASIRECQFAILEGLYMITKWRIFHFGEAELNWTRRKTLYARFIAITCFEHEARLRASAEKVLDTFHLSYYYMNKAICFVLTETEGEFDHVLCYLCRLKIGRWDDYRHCLMENLRFVEKLIDSLFNVTALSFHWRVPLLSSESDDDISVASDFNLCSGSSYNHHSHILIPPRMLLTELERVHQICKWAVECACDKCMRLMAHLARTNLWRTLGVLFKRLIFITADDGMVPYVQTLCNILELFTREGKHRIYWYGFYSEFELNVLKSMCDQEPRWINMGRCIQKALSWHTNEKLPDPRNTQFLLETDRELPIPYSRDKFYGILSYAFTLAQPIQSFKEHLLPVKKLVDNIRDKVIPLHPLDRKFAQERGWISVDLSLPSFSSRDTSQERNDALFDPRFFSEPESEEEDDIEEVVLYPPSHSSRPFSSFSPDSVHDEYLPPDFVF